MDSSMFFARKLAEDIMTYIYINFGILWQPIKGLWRVCPNYSVGEPIDGMQTLVKSLECIIENNMDDIAACYDELAKTESDNPVDFCYLALQAVPAYFPNGYSHQRMLCYCAMIAGVCRMCVANRRNGVLDSAADVFQMVFTAFIMTKEFSKEIFNQLVEVATSIVKKFPDEVREVDPPTQTVEGIEFCKCEM